MPLPFLLGAAALLAGAAGVKSAAEGVTKMKEANERVEEAKARRPAAFGQPRNNLRPADNDRRYF